MYLQTEPLVEIAQLAFSFNRYICLSTACIVGSLIWLVNERLNNQIKLPITIEDVMLVDVI
jgi:hypothetical protein